MTPGAYPPDITRAGIYPTAAPVPETHPDERYCRFCERWCPLGEFRAPTRGGRAHRPCDAARRRARRAADKALRPQPLPPGPKAKLPWHRLQTQWSKLRLRGEVGRELLAVYDAAARECVAARLPGWRYPALCGALGEELRSVAA